MWQRLAVIVVAMGVMAGAAFAESGDGTIYVPPTATPPAPVHHTTTVHSAPAAPASTNRNPIIGRWKAVMRGGYLCGSGSITISPASGGGLTGVGIMGHLNMNLMDIRAEGKNVSFHVTYIDTFGNPATGSFEGKWLKSGNAISGKTGGTWTSACTMTMTR